MKRHLATLALLLAATPALAATLSQADAKAACAALSAKGERCLVLSPG